MNGWFLSEVPEGRRLTAWIYSLPEAQQRLRTALRAEPTPSIGTIPSEFDPPPSGSLTIIVVQHSAQPLAAPDRSGATGVRVFLRYEPVTQPLIVPLAMIMHNEFVNRLPQRAFSEQNHPLQAGFLDGSDKAAWALRLGERGGSFTDFTPLVPRVSRNSAVNNGSRSWIKYRFPNEC
jgi:hypothetical protein